VIPSMNDQALTRASWPAFGEGGECPAWTCDCCVQHWPKMGVVSCQNLPYLPDGTDSFAPRMVEVCGIRYFACSESCARALFVIHHQYALREMPVEGRFVHLAYDFGTPSTHQPVLLDLDAATKMTMVEDNFGNRERKEGSDPDDEWVELRWWVADPQKPFGHNLIRRQAKKIMELWQARPARSLMSVPQQEPLSVI
jgi:hypothetical protein